MNKTELVQVLATTYFGGNRAAARRVLDAVLGTITSELVANDKVSISGFGVFEKVHKSARETRNPRTGERKPTPPRTIPRFRAGTELRAAVADSEPTPEASQGG